jgi:hypothetical protein
MAPDGDRDLRAYEAAGRCPSAPSGEAECRWTQEFTVSRVRLSNKRKKPNRAYLKDANGGDWVFSADKDPILAGLERGDRLTGTVWRGRITEITEVAGDGDTQKVYAAPVDLGTRSFIGALILIPPGLLGVFAGSWRLLRIRRPGTVPSLVATQGLAIALFMTGLFSPVFAGGEEEDFSRTLIAWLVMAAIAVIVALGYVAHARSENAGTA